MIKVIPDLPYFEKAPVFCWSDPVQKKQTKRLTWKKSDGNLLLAK